MTQNKPMRVIDQGGLEGTIEWYDDHNARVRFTDGRTVVVPRETLKLEGDVYRIHLDLARLNPRVEDEIVLPLLAEDLVVDKQTVENTVRIRKRVREETVTVDEALLRDQVEIERVPVDRYVDQRPETRYEDDTMIIPILEEVVVVEKRLLLREEIRITRRQTVAHDPQEYVLRREEASVSRDKSDQ